MGRVRAMRAVASMATVASMAAVRAVPCKQIGITRCLLQDKRGRVSISVILRNTKICIATNFRSNTLSCRG